MFPADDPLPKAITTFIQCNQSTAAPGIVWDALKAHLRGLIIKQISAIKSNNREWETLDSAESRKAEEHCIAQPSPDSERSWLDAQSPVVFMGQKRFFMQQRHFEEGENTGHVLSVISQAQWAKPQIDAIQTPLQWFMARVG